MLLGAIVSHVRPDGTASDRFTAPEKAFWEAIVTIDTAGEKTLLAAGETAAIK